MILADLTLYEYGRADRAHIRDNFRSIQAAHNTLAADMNANLRVQGDSINELREFLNFCVAKDPMIFSEFKRYMEAREKIESSIDGEDAHV
jgi:hypothetical protein